MPRHSPVIFWLLLAATLCVDVVTSVWFSQSLVQPQSRPLSSATLLIALAYAQVSLVCIRAVLRRSTNWIQWLMPFGAGIVVATIIIVEGIYEKPQREFPWAAMLAYTSIMWVQVASLLLVLWLLKPTRLFSRDVVAAGRSRWQFTIRHLLLLMTCLPILVIVFMNSEIVHSGVTASGTAQFVAWVTGNVVLPVVVVAIVERRWIWLLQLAAIAGAALATGLFLRWSVSELSQEIYMFVFALLQALVLWVWLHVIHVPLAQEASDDEPSQIPEFVDDATQPN